MMERNEFSYWLGIDGDNAEKAAAMLSADGTLALVGQHPGHAEFQVSEELGTIPKWVEMEDVLCRISHECPKAIMSVLAIDECTKAERRVVYAAGTRITDRRSRMVGADDICDRKTAQDIVAILEANGHKNAADLVKATYLE